MFIRDSQISAPTSAVDVSYGGTAYISNSVLGGGVKKAFFNENANCSFVFLENGTPLNSTCD